MSKMRIVMFVLAAGSAAMAGVLAKGLLNKKAPTEAAPVVVQAKTVDVLVAARDIELGEKLANGTINWKAWPAENVLEAMITRDEKPDADVAMAEYRVLLPMFEGETIIEKKLVDPKGGGFMSSVLPKGMRAISVAISDRSAAGGFIMPNDRVDVMITRKIQAPGSSTQLVKSETVLSNVRVMAINQTFRQAKEGEENSIKGTETATLELTQPQTEVIARVESEGEISLSLRSIAENDGAGMDRGPELAEKYRGDKKKARNNDTLFVRYGIETFATNN
jgi:pilus assembly protein CpaB